MTTWVLWISKDYPSHWSSALEYGYWDMLRIREVKVGDDVFFWQAGPRSRLLGWTQATTDAVDLQPGQLGPWLDAATAPYLRRFHFTLVSDQPKRSPRWGDVASATGLTPAPMSGIVSTVDPAAQTWLRSLFDPSARVDLKFSDDVQLRLEDLLEDTRDRASRTIALRRGQREFRSALLQAYEGTCAITGCTTVEVLEAAHISPHLGAHTNVVPNGLLLRADVHTLFDLNLITVTGDLRVRVSPTLAESDYMAYDGQPLASAPQRQEQRPASEPLQSHQGLCDWFDDAPAVLF